MTRKKFIKTLRAYGLNRNEINMLVNKIVEKKGKLSYNDAITKIQLHITQKLMSGAIKIPTNYFCKPVDFTDYLGTNEYKFDYRLLGVDLANKPDKYVVVRSSAN